jgi:N-acetylneuraminic acid mutarotase
MSKSPALLLVLIFLIASCLVVSKPAFSSADTAEDTWETMAPMPTARRLLGVATVNDKISAIGGTKDATGLTAANEMYDPMTNTWTSKRAMPTPRFSFGIAVVGDRIYCVGGYARADGSSSYVNSTVNEVYNPATDSWASLRSPPIAAESLVANVVNGKVYLMGVNEQLSSTDSLIASTQVYDPATDTWEIRKPMPTPVKLFASTVVDNKIYVIGGANNQAVFWAFDAVNVVQIYDCNTDTWSYGTPLPVGAVGAVAATTSGVYAPKRIYVEGGYGVNCSDANFVYDPKTGSWTSGTPMLTPRGYLGIGVVNDVLYVIGGTGRVSIAPDVAINEKYTPFGYGSRLLVVRILSPEENKTYPSSSASLAFTLSENASWMGYSLDGEDNVTITGNTTLSGLSNGLHNVTVYARDEFENTGASETISFSVDVPFPTALVVAASGASIAIISVGLLFYFKKRKR